MENDQKVVKVVKQSEFSKYKYKLFLEDEKRLRNHKKEAFKEGSTEEGEIEKQLQYEADVGD